MERWQWQAAGVAVAVDELSVVDVDADGRAEILGMDRLATGGYAWTYRAVPSGGYALHWRVPGFAYEHVRAAQLDADPQLEIVVGGSDEVRVYDGLRHTLEARVATATPALAGLAAGDVDADGEPELVLLHARGLEVRDLATGALEFADADRSGTDLVLASLDGDSALEIVIVDGLGAGVAIDGATHAVDWSASAAVGSRLRVANLDGDPADELLTWTVGGGLTAWDIAGSAPFYTLSGLYLDSVWVGDLDGDGAPELVHDGAAVGLQVRDARNGTFLRNIAGEQPDIGSAGQLDDDPGAEIVGTTLPNDPRKRLAVLDATSGAVEWRAEGVTTPVQTVDAADLDGDGATEIVTASLRGPPVFYGVPPGGRVVVLSGRDGAPTYLDPDTSVYSEIPIVRVHDVDGDRRPDLLVAIANGAGPDRVVCLDAPGGNERWRFELPTGMGPASLELLDALRTGTPQLLLGTRTWAGEARVFALDPLTGELVWRSQNLGGPYATSMDFLRIGELDRHRRQVIVGLRDSGYATLDAESGALVGADRIGVHTRGLAVRDIDGDGVSEVFLGGHQGALVQRYPDLTLRTILQNATAFDLDGLLVHDVDGDGREDFLFGDGGRLVVRSGETLEVIFASDVLGPAVGAVDAIRLVELDGDPALEIAVATGIGVAVFDDTRIFRDGFESPLGTGWRFEPLP